jgi:hypothetical protein
VETAETVKAMARTKPTWRSLLVKELVMFGSHWHR